MNQISRNIGLASLLVLVAMIFIAGEVALPETEPAVDRSAATHLLMFEDRADPDQLVAELESLYAVKAEFIYRHAVKGASMQIPSQILADISRHPGVKHVESNREAELAAFPVTQEVPTWMRRDGLDTPHPFIDINGDDVATDVDIAIIDSGVDASHPDLNVYRATNCVFDGVINACDPIDPLTATDTNGHGTRVAGIAAARDNGFGIVGMAPGARIWAVKLISGEDPPFGDAGLFLDPVLNLAAVVAAIDWVTANAAEIDVVNMSLGIPNSESATMRAALAALVGTGTPIFVSAGNKVEDVFGVDGVFGGGDDWEPAAFPEVATISGYTDLDGLSGGLAATTPFGETDDTFWESLTHPGGVFGSNYSTAEHPQNPVSSQGAAIDFAMPAVEIMTTCSSMIAPLLNVEIFPGECEDTSDEVGGNYGRITGTSFAVPQAAGLAGLMIALNGSSEFDGVAGLDENDTYALRQGLIDLAIAQDDASFGLVPSPGDPDSNPDPLGSARMVLGLDASSLTLPDIGSTDTVTVSTPFLPIGATDSIQLNLIHDSSQFTVHSPLCSSVFSTGTPIAPTPNTGATGTVIGCTAGSGAETNGGNVLSFVVERVANGAASFTLDSSGLPEGSGFIEASVLVPNAPLPFFSVNFAAIINGSFDLQVITDALILAGIQPSVTATLVSGSPDFPGQYDSSDGTFSISVDQPGDYELQAAAAGFISRHYDSSPVVVGADGTVSGEPGSTTLHGGDVNEDGSINGGDIASWLVSFGEPTTDRRDPSNSNSVVDIDGDGEVTARDMSVLISNLGLPSPDGLEAWDAP